MEGRAKKKKDYKKGGAYRLTHWHPTHTLTRHEENELEKVVEKTGKNGRLLKALCEVRGFLPVHKFPSFIARCSCSQVGKKEPDMCVCSWDSGSSRGVSHCVSLCEFGVSLEELSARCNDGEPEPAQPKLNSREPNEWGGRLFASSQFPVPVKRRLQRFGAHA